MKTRLFGICLLSVAIPLLLSGFAYGVPKYTDKETAMELAKILDKGAFGRFTISSTYVQNDNIQDYYISVILSDGSSQKWYINQIYKWSRDDRIRLTGNRSLLFPDLDDSRFVVLNKNEFHRMALKANVYVKTFPSGDPLENMQFRFRIKSFDLISPTETAFGRDRTGSKYRYIVGLFNGMNELLTYERAYKILQTKSMLSEGTFTAPTFERAYQVTKIIGHEKGPPVDGVSQFGVEIQFDRQIQLSGEHFPYEIFERKRFYKRSSKPKKEFELDITIPNSERKTEIVPIKNLEYLYNINIVRNPKFHKRLLLRASFNPTVMDIPPLVYKNGDNSIYITFFNLLDQTILSRGMLLEAKKREEAERKSSKDIIVTKAGKKDSDFDRSFIEAVKTMVEADAAADFGKKREKLLQGIGRFEEAALYAETDEQLFKALAKRNHMREMFIVVVLRSARAKLEKKPVDGSDFPELLNALDQAEAFTGDERMLESIGKLKKRVIANQK